MIIGIDHGNAQIKTRNTCFVSGVSHQTAHGSGRHPV